MMSPYEVIGEQVYGPKKTRHRTPDVLVSGTDGIVAAIECKAKRMSFDARYADDPVASARSEEHTSELQSLMRISYAVFCLKKKQRTTQICHRTPTRRKHIHPAIS